MSGNELLIIEENVNSARATTAKTLDADQFSVQIVGNIASATGEAIVDIEVSNVPNPTVDGDWALAGTITLALTTENSSDALAVLVPYKRVRAKATTLTAGGKFSAYVCEG